MCVSMCVCVIVCLIAVSLLYSQIIIILLILQGQKWGQWYIESSFESHVSGTPMKRRRKRYTSTQGTSKITCRLDITGNNLQLCPSSLMDFYATFSDYTRLLFPGTDNCFQQANEDSVHFHVLACGNLIHFHVTDKLQLQTLQMEQTLPILVITNARILRFSQCSSEFHFPFHIQLRTYKFHSTLLFKFRPPFQSPIRVEKQSLPFTVLTFYFSISIRDFCLL